MAPDHSLPPISGEIACGLRFVDNPVDKHLGEWGMVTVLLRDDVVAFGRRFDRALQRANECALGKLFARRYIVTHGNANAATRRGEVLVEVLETQSANRRRDLLPVLAEPVIPVR